MRACSGFKEVLKSKIIKPKRSLCLPNLNIISINLKQKLKKTFLPDHSKFPLVVRHGELQDLGFPCQIACSRLKHQIHMQCVSVLIHPVSVSCQDVQHYVPASERDNTRGNPFVQNVDLRLYKNNNNKDAFRT